MAPSITTIADPDSTDGNTGVFDVLFDNSYTANGYPLTAADFNRAAIYNCVPVQKGTANRIITWDPSSSTAGKLRIWTALGTEATGSSDQSSISCRCYITGPRR